jgi:hypothetical protein
MWFSKRADKKALIEGGVLCLALGSGALAVAAAYGQLGIRHNQAIRLIWTGMAVFAGGLVMVLLGTVWPTPRTGHHRVRVATKDDCEQVREFLVPYFGQIIPRVRDLQAMLDRNPTQCYMIEVPPPVSRETGWTLVGCFSILPLKTAAVRLLDKGDLEGRALTPEHIASKKGKPRALYIGTVVGADIAAKGFAIKVLKQEIKNLCEKHKIVKLFARPMTADGVRLMAKYGFLTVVDGDGPKLNTVCAAEWSG